MKDFVQFLVTSLVKNPQSVKVEEVQDGQTYRYNIAVDPADMGIVIGKEGRTINSLRALAKAKAVKQRIWVDVKLLDSQSNQAKAKDLVRNAYNQSEKKPEDVANAVDIKSATDRDHA